MRYAVFAGTNYYPLGGLDDLKGTFATLEEAIAATPPKSDDWAHVVDLSTMQKVAEVTCSSESTPCDCGCGQEHRALVWQVFSA